MRLLLITTLCAALAAPLASQGGWLKVYTTTGPNGGISYGFSVAPVDDLNGDGGQDLLVGALGQDRTGRNSGSVYVLVGSTGAQIRIVDGEGAGDLFGAAVAGLSDYNGDGKPEFAVGAPYHSSGAGGFLAGKLYIVDGATGSFLDAVSGTFPGNLIGYALAGCDVDGDGTRELAAGVPTGGGPSQTGEVRFYRWNGAGVSLLSTVTGAAAGEMFGHAVATLGSISGAPGEELAAGSPYADDGGPDSGACTVLSNLQAGLSVAPSVAGGRCGFAVAGAPFLLEEGESYLVAGAPGAGNGAVYLWNAVTGVLARQLNGAAAGEQFGYAVCAFGDANFDRYPEVGVGAPFASGGLGRVQVYDVFAPGGPATLLSDTGLLGSRMGAALGSGDFDGNGIDDLAVSGPYTNAGLGPRQGAVSVWYPPNTNLDDPLLELLAPLVEDQNTNIRLTSLKENVTVYVYVGNQPVPSTSALGHLLSISSAQTPFNPFVTRNNVTGGAVTVTYTTPFGQALAGKTLYFQGVEQDVPGFLRYSNVDSDVVQAAQFELSANLPIVSATTEVLTTKYGFPGAQTFFFAATALGSSSGSGACLGIVNSGLTSPTCLGQATGNSLGAATFNWAVPAGAKNQHLFVSAVSTSSGQEKLDVIDVGVIQ